MATVIEMAETKEFLVKKINAAIDEVQKTSAVSGIDFSEVEDERRKKEKDAIKEKMEVYKGLLPYLDILDKATANWLRQLKPTDPSPTNPCLVCELHQEIRNSIPGIQSFSFKEADGSVTRGFSAQKLAEEKDSRLKKIKSAISKMRSELDRLKPKLVHQKNKGELETTKQCSSPLHPNRFTKVEDAIKAIEADMIKNTEVNVIRADWEILNHLYNLDNETVEWLKVLKSGHPCLKNPSFTYKLGLKKWKSSHPCLKNPSQKESGKIRVDQETTKTETETESSSKDQDVEVIYRWSSPAKLSVHGFDDKVRIMDRLLTAEDSNDGLNAIGIVGMTGVGKTALCQVAFDEQLVKEKFFPRIWVCLSKQAKDLEIEEYKKEVVKRMLICLGFENVFNNEGGQGNNEGGQGNDLQSLLVALRQELEGKRYLIVLDDIPKEIQDFCATLNGKEDCKQNENELRCGLPRGQGSTVIVTSRYKKTAEAVVGKENLLHLFPLPEEESCWKICTDAIPKDVSRTGSQPAKHTGKPKGWPLSYKKKIAELMRHEKIELLQNDVKKKCHGLPLLAKMMARVMKEKAAEAEADDAGRSSDEASTTDMTHQKETLEEKKGDK